MRLSRSLLLLCACHFCASPPARAQQLKDLGILATGALSRTRVAGGEFELGDMMYVTAVQSANTGGMYVSAHMEYNDPQQGWLPVPTAPTPLGNEYRSGKYVGLRDYVRFGAASTNVTRHICLFMPYAAASLPDGRVYERRYVIRLWDSENQEVANTALTPDSVRAEQSDGRLVLTLVRAKTCGSMVDSTHPAPVAESQDTGSVRFFSTSSGKWVCHAND